MVAAIVLACSTTAARAHVALDAPNGGEQLEVGSVFTITWHIQIAHDLQNWDLWYSKISNTGPWTSIAQNLPAGSGSPNSIHTYDWTIPCLVDDSVWVRVRMDNSGQDYEDVSNAPFSTTVPSGTTMVLVGPNGVPLFAPNALEIEAGETIRWCWDSGGHNVVSGLPGAADGAFFSGDPAPAGTMFDVLFDQAFLDANPQPDGVYDYHCHPHGNFGMVAAITVAVPCLADLTGDGIVNAGDLAQLLGSWGPCAGCPADFTGDGIVDAADLAQLLGGWGPCD